MHSLIISLASKSLPAIIVLLYSIASRYHGDFASNAKALTILSYSAVFATFSRLGLDNYLFIKYRNKNTKRVRKLILDLSLLSLLVTLVTAPLFYMIFLGSNKTLFLYIPLLSVSLSSNALYCLYLSLTKRYNTSFLLRGSITFLIAFPFIYVESQYSIEIMVVLSAIVNVAIFLLLVCKQKNEWYFNITKRPRLLRWVLILLRQSVANFLYTLLFSIMQNILVILGSLSSNNHLTLDLNLIQKGSNSLNVVAQVAFFKYIDLFKDRDISKYVYIATIPLIFLVYELNNDNFSGIYNILYCSLALSLVYLFFNFSHYAYIKSAKFIEPSISILLTLITIVASIYIYPPSGIDGYSTYLCICVILGMTFLALLGSIKHHAHNM